MRVGIISVFTAGRPASSVSRRVLGRLALALVLLLVGCAGARPAPRVAAGDSPPAPGPNGVTVNVELAAPAEVSKSALYGAGGGLLEAGKLTGEMIPDLVAATLLGGPAGAAAAVVGAGIGLLVVAPIFVVEGSLNASQREAVLRAIDATDFPSRLRRALERRLARASGLRLDVTIQTYGFLNNGAGGRHFCFAANLSVDATVEERVVLHEEFAMSHAGGSEHVPPTECAELADIAAADGRAARRVLGDAAEILAAVIVKRLGVTR